MGPTIDLGSGHNASTAPTHIGFTWPILINTTDLPGTYWNNILVNMK
jgi:hypothetical protein